MGLDGVVTVLSGMSTIRQMEENYKTLISKKTLVGVKPLGFSSRDKIEKSMSIIGSQY